MSRATRGYQRAWQREVQWFPWYWKYGYTRSRPSAAETEATLERLERAWQEGGNYAALRDAMDIVAATGTLREVTTDSSVDGNVCVVSAGKQNQPFRHPWIRRRLRTRYRDRFTFDR